MTAAANRTQPNGWPGLPEQRQLVSVRVDPPLNESLILCLCKFFTSFVLILYVTATLTLSHGSEERHQKNDKELGYIRQWFRRPGFNPWSRHIKDFKNGTCYLLG